MDAPGTGRDWGTAPTGFRLPAETRLGRTTLQVSDLGRSVDYYRQVLGIQLDQQNASAAVLSVAERDQPLLELRHQRGTRPVARGATLGLFHFAILLPSRESLGAFVRHMASLGLQFGAADHLVSEAIYLWDPDGLGIEVYADRPRDQWKRNGRELMMTTERLDLRDLMDAGSSAAWRGMPDGTTMGHMHLSVGNLAASSDFYHSALGMDTTVWSYPGALFMSAGGYHHHLGTNTWAMGARPPVESDARLLEWELVLPTDADVESASTSLRNAHYDVTGGVVADPWGTLLRLSAS